MLATKRAVISFFGMIFNNRIKKVVAVCVSGFFLGILVTTLSLTTKGKYTKKTAMGGFETSSSPELSAEMLGERQIEEEILNDELPPLTYKTYRVKQGDMIGSIAADNDISQDTLISVNHITSTRRIQIGQYLKIPSLPGILYTVREDGETFAKIAEKYEINAEKCASVNGMAQEVALKAGDTLFLPDAQMDWVTRQEINGDLFKRPIKNRYYISSNYGWRSSPFGGARSFHGGTDMASSTGTPIYAALEGRVSFAGYNDVYGNYVIVTHHSGYKSLYGHMSSISVKKGQYVYTNTQIGKVGSTGMSTGPHLHFAVYKNGKSLNPMTLVN
ncbi:MAG: M23 family metallopeptidase [Treponema sp.]|nr:M23 family metallopeptidase [Treponema sp.]